MGGVRTGDKGIAFRRKERRSEAKSAWHGGYVALIICRPDCQPDLLFNHNATTHLLDAADKHI